MVDARQLHAAVGECPTVDVAPRLEHPEDTVELPRQRFCAPPDTPLEPFGVARQSLGPLGGPEMGGKIGTRTDGMGVELGGQRHGAVPGA